MNVTCLDWHYYKVFLPKKEYFVTKFGMSEKGSTENAVMLTCIFNAVFCVGRQRRHLETGPVVLLHVTGPREDV